MRLVVIHDQVLSYESKRANIDFEDILRYECYISVPSVGNLIYLILRKAHNSIYCIHLGTSKMYNDFRQHYWWISLNKDAIDFVSHYLFCQ